MSNLEDAANKLLTSPETFRANVASAGNVSERSTAASVSLTTEDENVRTSASSSAGDVLCPRCQTLNPSGSTLCVNCRKFVPANQGARTHGIYSRQPPPEDLRVKVAELRSGVVSDRGGEAELSTLEHSYVEKLGDIDVTIRLLTHDIAVNGLLTPGGRVRDVYEKLLAGLATFDRYAQRIGLERRAKRVESLVEVMNHGD